MFASTLQSVSYRTKQMPTLTTRAPSVSYRSSSRPDIALYERSAEVVRQIKLELQSIYQHRLALLPRDLQAMFDERRQWFTIVMGFRSPSDLFVECDQDKDGELNQQEQIRIFAILLARLYNRKEQLIATQMYSEHASLLEVIKSVEAMLPEIERAIRSRITEVKQALHSSRKVKALGDFDRKAQTSQKVFQSQKEARLASLRQKQREEIRTLEQRLEESNPGRLYQNRPSFKLRNTKDMLLLEKLSPYRSEKKRGYEGELLNRSVAEAVVQEEDRINKSIETKKNLQRIHLRKAHQRELEITRDKLRMQEAQLLETITQQKNTLRKSQDNLAAVVLARDRKEAANRINWVAKAPKSYREHEDSLNIASIVMRHRDQVQFNNSIEKLSTLASYNQEAIRDYRYFGSEAIQTTRRLLNRTIDVAPARDWQVGHLVKSPGKHENDVLAEPSAALQQQKSLTDLYDKNLNPVG